MSESQIDAMADFIYHECGHRGSFHSSDDPGMWRQTARVLYYTPAKERAFTSADVRKIARQSGATIERVLTILSALGRRPRATFWDRAKAWVGI